MVKNVKQSKLHKEYIELKRKISYAQYNLECAKNEYWDSKWRFTDEITFNKRKAQMIREIKLELKCLHRESKILKMKIVKVNRAYQREHLLDKMNDICDRIIRKL